MYPGAGRALLLMASALSCFQVRKKLSWWTGRTVLLDCFTVENPRIITESFPLEAIHRVEYFFQMFIENGNHKPYQLSCFVGPSAYFYVTWATNQSTNRLLMPKTWRFSGLHSSYSCWGLHGLHWPSQRFFRSAQFPACWASGERGVHSLEVCRKCTTLPLFAHRCCSCFVHLLDHVLAGKCWTNSSGDQKQQYEYIVQQSSGLASCPAPAISRSEAFPALTSEFVAGLRPSVLGGGVRTVLFVPCFIWFCMILPTSYVSVCRTCCEDS